MTDVAAVDRFMQAAPEQARERLEQIRAAVKAAVPEATQVISYGIPTFQLNGKNMIHYGFGKQHIGLYATPDGHIEFEEELNRYQRGKGSVRFPLDQPLPIELITRISIFRAQQIRKQGESR